MKLVVLHLQVLTSDCERCRGPTSLYLLGLGGKAGQRIHREHHKTILCLQHVIHASSLSHKQFPDILQTFCIAAVVVWIEKATNVEKVLTPLRTSRDPGGFLTLAIMKYDGELHDTHGFCFNNS